MLRGLADLSTSALERFGDELASGRQVAEAPQKGCTYGAMNHFIDFRTIHRPAK